MKTRYLSEMHVGMCICLMAFLLGASFAGEAQAVTPQVATADSHTVGLKSDGMVVAVGDNSDGQCNVDGWTDIIQISAGDFHTVGLKWDGTVVAVGDNTHGQCDVTGWAGIAQVVAGGAHTVGLKSDGTVAAIGYGYYGQCDKAYPLRPCAGLAHPVDRAVPEGAGGNQRSHCQGIGRQ